MKPFLSVIIPVYNAQTYLEECIASIISQEKFEYTEVLLIDDGSSDSSGKICDSFSEKYKNILTFHNKNAGVSAARNFGVSNSSGEYIYFIDADDKISENTFSSVIDTAQKLSPDMIFFSYIYDHPDFQKIIDYPFEERTVLQKDFIRSEMALFMLKKTFLNSVWNKVLKKSVVTENGILFPVGKKYGEDRDFVIDVLKKITTAYYIPEPFYFYRYVKSGAIQKSRTNYFENIFSEMQDTQKAFEDFDIPDSVFEQTLADVTADRIISTCFHAYTNCTKKDFSLSLSSLFENDRLLEFVKKYSESGKLQNDKVKSELSQCILSRSAGKVSSFLFKQNLKEKLYKIKQRTKI